MLKLLDAIGIKNLIITELILIGSALILSIITIINILIDIKNKDETTLRLIKGNDIRIFLWFLMFMFMVYKFISIVVNFGDLSKELSLYFL